MKHWASALLALCLLVACTTPPPTVQVPPQPEGPSGFMAKPGWTTSRTAVAAANPLATEAGLQVLRSGGSAVDAAIAVQMVLTLVEPQSSGIGGGAFLMHWDGKAVQAWDGRETAPAGVDERLFMLPAGQPMSLHQAIVGGRSVGVPGAVRMLEEAHRQHGRLPWARLFEPAIVLAEQGFRISHRLRSQLEFSTALKTDARAAAYYFDVNQQPLPVGHLLRNPAMAKLLRDIAARGSAALYQGRAAADMVARVQGHESNPGKLSLSDLAAYRPVQREPICTDWKARYRVCGMPPPSSGHLAVMQILGTLENAWPPSVPAGLNSRPVTPLEDGLPSADWLHAYTESARLAYADRDRYVADPAFVEAPGGDWRSLLGPAYLKQRAHLIRPRSMGTAEPGVPAATRVALGSDTGTPEHGTSHISIVDDHGNALAMTTTIEAVWGSGILSDGGTGLPGGFLLNNQLTDFSMRPVDSQGRPIANRVQPGKRPRSSMSPTLVFDRQTGQFLMSLGSPGGAFIIHFTAKTLIGTLDWGLNVQQAIDLPNFSSFNGPTVLEEGRFPAATVLSLQKRDHKVVQMAQPSGLQGIQRTANGWFGGADPRREGVVMGD